MSNNRRKAGLGEGFPNIFFLLGDSLLPHPSCKSFHMLGLRLQGMRGPYFLLEVYSGKESSHLSLLCSYPSHPEIALTTFSQWGKW